MHAGLGEISLKKAWLFTLLLVSSCAAAYGQARATASRIGDLQIGGGYSMSKEDYLTNRLTGFNFYADFDFRPHWGVELNFHQLNDHTQVSDPSGSGGTVSTKVYERTYEVGGRYLLCHCYHRFVPYAKGLYGRGVYNFPFDAANLAYNMGVAGGGVDIAVHKRVNVRVDYEYQKWFGFQYSGLHPQVVTVGAAYHFGPGKPH